MPSVSVEGERKATVGSPVELKLALFVIYRYRISIVYILTLLKNIDIDMVIIENIDILLIEYQIFISILDKLANFKNIDRFGVGGRSPPSSLTETICENVDPFLSFIKLQNNPKYGNLSNIPPGGVDTCLFAPPSETVGVVLFLSAEDQTKCYVNLS